MRLLDSQLVFSATDLVGYSECAHLATLEREATAGRLKRPHRHDPELDIIEARGFEHEARYLESLTGKRVVKLDGPPRRTRAELEAAAERTVAALREGADVVYQGTLFDGRWVGHPDFLVRVDRSNHERDRVAASRLAMTFGGWSYEVADAKLARHVKVGAVLQCCVYSDLLAKVQGHLPWRAHVVIGSGESHPLLLSEYAAFFRWTRKGFEARFAAEQGEGGDTYPEPVDHCRVCRWYGPCADRRRADDHLSRVAGISRGHTKALVTAGVPTLTKLGTAEPETRVPHVPPQSFERLRDQAALQLQQYEDGQVRYRLLPIDEAQPGRGLERLPPPSAMDVFLDLESHPWAGADGLDYLFGTVVSEEGKAVYTARWAHDAHGEKQAFEAVIDFVMERHRADPGMHLYHYGAYERTALRRLMGRYATREDEVDALLRGEVLVDLFEVVRQGVRVSQESYSLKKVEALYLETREGPRTQPGFALVEYDRWLRSKDESVLPPIEAYNRDDCVSAWKLREWLEERRGEAEEALGRGLGRPAEKVEETTETALEWAAAVARRTEALRRGVPDDPAERSVEQQGRWVLAGLVDWHRREQKPEWWLHFDLVAAPMEDLVERPDALGGLSYEGAVGQRAQSIIHRYRYDPRQEHKFREEQRPIDPVTGGGAGVIVAVDPVGGSIDLMRSGKSPAPHPQALIPEKPRPAIAQREALGRMADAVIAAGGLDGKHGRRAAADLLLRRAPRIRGEEAGARLVRGNEDVVSAARRLALALEETCLAVQGPPGAGKTYTGARMIVDLVRAGRTVGIVATAHKAITNLVDAVCDAAGKEVGPAISVVQKADDGVASDDPAVRVVGSNDDVVSALDNRMCSVVAGTPWLFARGEMEGRLDVLFVDEAGQMSLADVVAISGAARSLVLLGDPSQLPQVTQGTHPDGAELSALEHVLDGAGTIREDRGLFLPETRRLHPAVCAYISSAFYDDRLEPHMSTGLQSVARGALLHGTGLRYVPVAHHGNGARSVEEAEAVARLVKALLGRKWSDQHGAKRVIGLDDILIVAPYNAQVGEIGRRVETVVGARPRVGTVDKFQGQEGAVVIFSMTTSSPDDAPRGMDFLYSRHRLNVAISRARALAVLVCSPELFRFRCRTPEHMRLANALCLFAESAERVSV